MIEKLEPMTVDPLVYVEEMFDKINQLCKEVNRLTEAVEKLENRTTASTPLD